MASSQQSSHRRNKSSPDTPTQSIPLQDLEYKGAGGVLSQDGDTRAGRVLRSQESDTRAGAEDDTRLRTGDVRSHRRTLSDRGRSLFRRNRESLLNKSPQVYAPIGEEDDGSPSPPTTRRNDRQLSPSLRIITPSGQHAHVDEETDELTPLSPIGPGYQDAIGFAGLSFDGPSSNLSLHADRSRNSLSTIHIVNTTPGSLIDEELDDPTGYFPHENDMDTLPLTDSSNLHGSSTLEPTTPSGQRGRGSFQSVRFLSPSSHLGDDLHDPEAGTLGPDAHGRWSRSPEESMRGRSLSPASAESPLTKAGHMMRKISMRVVNLTNEADLVERDIRRKSSIGHAPRLQLPPLDTNLDHLSADGAASIKSPVSEKVPSIVSKSAEQSPTQNHQHDSNPLKGRSLGFFSSTSKVRLKLMDVLLHPFTEPFILVLIVAQTVLLAIDARKSVFTHPRSKAWGSTWIDYALLALFIIYTIEIIIRIIVSGFIVNPIEYSTINRQIGIKAAISKKANDMFALHRKPSVKHNDHVLSSHPTPGLIRAFTRADTFSDAPGGSVQAQKARLAHRAFLRHSFNRLDFLAVISFWISFWIGIFGVETQRHVYVFRMLSCLRILRLLGITSGTSVILRSLKKAAPSLLNVAFLTGFFWLLFAIVGIQSFKSSLRRSCVWIDPLGNTDNNWVNEAVFCGGYLKGTLQNYTMEPWVHANGMPSSTSHKGYLCPVGSLCMEGANPYNGTASFDNLVQSLELVFVIMTSNTFSDLVDYTTNSDYLAAAIFFACGIIIFPLWLVNLLIAVITSSFQVIRDESKASAFTAQEQHGIHDDELDEEKPKPKVSTLKQWYDKTSRLWIAVIVYDLIVQCLRSDTMSNSRQNFINASELGVTIVLLFEIIVRFIVDWRHFFKSRRNCVDLALAIVTTVIQIPPIKNSGPPYAWLTVFQILRIYRVVLAVDLTRDLIMTVLGNFSGLANLILFVFLLCFLGAIFATQIFRGELPEQSDDGETLVVSFFNIWNAFLGMYQIFSSENWTTILYNVTSYNVEWDNGWIGAAFCILWFILANFVVLNMFIAVIQENFDVSEDEKRLQQVKAFLSQRDLGQGGQGTLSLSTIFKFGQVRRQDPLAYGNAATEMLLKDAVVRDFLDDEVVEPGTESPPDSAGLPPRSGPVVKPGILANLWEKTINRLFNREPNPFYARLEFSRAHEELDPRQMARELMSATDRRKKAQREYLRKHPKYNVSLYLFPINNPIRRICQLAVGPGRGGDRIEGPAPNTIAWYAFSAFIYAAIVAMVLLACVTTPLYQKDYFTKNGFSAANWFVYTDIGFAVLFIVESIIRVVADGFFWTPNAYYRGSWGFIDGVVLLTLWANIIALLYDPAGGSRVVGAFKALRALRLLNVSDSARDTFHSVIVVGGWKVISAAFVSLSLLIPFAILGLNLFNGRMQSCNDDAGGIFNLTDCTGEYMSKPYNWDVLAPRVVSNNYYDFDSFGGALFILFQIVSQEGWVDVMWSAQSISGVFTQPQPFEAPANAVFFVIFNLLGAVFVLTLFVSVFMRNYTEQTGVAYLTTDQRSWLELRKLLKQINPSKRSSKKENERAKWKQWCYKLAVQKSGKWQKFVTSVLIFHLILLCLEWYPSETIWLRTRDFIFLVLTFFYTANIVIRIVGLTWARFRRSAWDLYSIFSVSGTFVTTVLLLSDFNQRDYVQLHKLFLVSIALLLIPRNNQLDQLFKTAAASVNQIANLLATWFVLFLVYAIAFTQTFGLTRFGENEEGNVNFRTVPKALILLFRMSSGEGWNQNMVDFAEIEPPLCTVGERYYDGDCGSSGWARALFISWNLLSMYIFMNLFVSLIYESFSYVYQRSSGLSVISREEIRRFKQAWAEFDPSGTGYISKEKFPRLLGELSGVFEMRIYDGDFTVSSILEDILPRAPSRAPALAFGGNPSHDHHHLGHSKKRPLHTPIDLDALNARIAEIPTWEIQKRRTRMTTFYEEVLVSADLDKGIEFSSLLMILAHHKVINDNKSLRLEEFLRRRARLQRVEEAVRRNVVVGFFDTLYWSRRFKKEIARRKQARLDSITEGRLQGVPQLEVPEIFVHDESDDENNNDGRSSRLSDGYNSMPATPVDKEGPVNFWDVPISPIGNDSGERGRSNSIQVSPNASPTRRRFQAHSPSPNNTPRATMEVPSDWQFANAILGTTGDHDGKRDRSPTPSHDGASGGIGGGGLSPSFGPTNSRSLDPFDFSTDGSSDLGLAVLGSSIANIGTGSGSYTGGSAGVSPSASATHSPRSRTGTFSAAFNGGRVRAGTLTVPGPAVEGGEGGAGSGARNRAVSNLSQRDLVLGELENSAWGASIRRSFTTAAQGGRRESSGGGGPRAVGGTVRTSRVGGGSPGRRSPSPGKPPLPRSGSGFSAGSGGAAAAGPSDTSSGGGAGGGR